VLACASRHAIDHRRACSGLWTRLDVTKAPCGNSSVTRLSSACGRSGSEAKRDGVGVPPVRFPVSLSPISSLPEAQVINAHLPSGLKSNESSWKSGGVC
jgi:hypothetical protein